MPRGRPKKSSETLNVEIRESKEVQLMEDKPKDIVNNFLKNETDVNRSLTAQEEMAIINLTKIINRYICDVKVAVQVSTSIIRHYYESSEFRLDSKVFCTPVKDIVVDKFIIPFTVKYTPKNKPYNIRLTCIKYSYKDNSMTEETLCEF